MDLRLVNGERLAQLLSAREAVSALERAFGEQVPGIPDRQHLDVGGGDLLVMPAWSDEAAGTKLVTVAPGNPDRGLPLIQGVYVLFDKPALRPVALFDAAPLTALRTAAVSAVATRHLARSDSRCLVVFGAGVQARGHIDAMRQVLDLDRVGIVSRTRPRAEELAARARSQGLEADVVTPEAVADADVICTCTTSPEPLFDGDLLQAGVHINAVGSYRRDARELDDRSMARADLVCADTAAALRESGDLATPLDNGSLQRGRVRLLSGVLDGTGRGSSHEITIFKSVGAAFQDLAIAEAAASRL